MSAYTDADVQAATAELVEAPLENSEEQDVRLILDAVAPAIAARALREAAESWGRGLTATDQWLGTTVAAELNARADDIERTP